MNSSTVTAPTRPGKLRPRKLSKSALAAFFYDVLEPEFEEAATNKTTTAALTLLQRVVTTGFPPDVRYRLEKIEEELVSGNAVTARNLLLILITDLEASNVADNAPESEYVDVAAKVTELFSACEFDLLQTPADGRGYEAITALATLRNEVISTLEKYL